MLFLVDTDILEVATSSTSGPQLDAHISFVDLTVPMMTPSNSSRAYAIITAKNVTTKVLDGPGLSKLRDVKTVNIRNRHPSQSVTVTLRVNGGAWVCELAKVLLESNETFGFADGTGWFHLQVPGVPVQIPVQPPAEG